MRNMQVNGKWRGGTLLATLMCASVMGVGGICLDDGSSSPAGKDTGERLPLTRYMDKLAIESEEKTVDGLPDRWSSIVWDDGSEKGLRGPKCMFDKAYKTYYRSSLDDVNDRVVLYLGPGGACFDALTCLIPYQLSGGKVSLARTDPKGPLDQEEKGILSSKEGVSPLHALPIVFAPYCDASTFAGDNDVEYKSPLFLFPEPTKKMAYHRGLQNLSAAIATIQKKFSKAPKEIVILGSSAGGFGILVALGLVNEVFPETDIFVFSDSAPPMFSPEAKAAISDMFKNWKFEDQFPVGCNNCDGPSFYPIISHYLKAIPKIKRIGFAGFKRDEIISTYLLFSLFGFEELILKPIEALPHRGLVDEFRKALLETYKIIVGVPGIDAYEAMLLSESKKIADAFPNRVKRFLTKGKHHMMLFSEPPHSESNPSINGVEAYDWLEQLIDSDKAWSDQIME